MVHWTFPRETDAPLDEAIVSALSSPRDRGTVLSLEESVRSFLSSPPPDETLTFPNAKLTYQRMLAHKVAQYYRLKTASIDLQGKGSMVMASFVDGASRPSLQITPLAELVPVNEGGEYASNESDQGSRSEGWASEASTSGPHGAQRFPGDSRPSQGRPLSQGHAQPQQLRQPQQAPPPPQQQQGQYPGAYDYSRQQQAAPGSPGSSYGPMPYPYATPMPGYAMASNGMYVPMVSPSGAAMAPYGMPMVPQGATTLYPGGYAAMTGYPPPMMGQMGQEAHMVPGMVAYVMPPSPTMASSPVAATAEQQAYMHQQYQQQYGMAPRPHLSSPMAQPQVMSPHGPGQMTPVYAAPPHTGGALQPPPSSRVSSAHIPPQPRVASPQAQPQHSRVAGGQMPMHGGYYPAAGQHSIVNSQKQKPYPYPGGQPGAPVQQHLYDYQQQQAYGQRGSAGGGGSMGKAPSSGPASGTIRAMKGELMRMYHSPSGPQRSGPSSPQPQQMSRVRKPTVDVGEAAGDLPGQHEEHQEGGGQAGAEAVHETQGPGTGEEGDEVPEQPYSPNAQRLSPTQLTHGEGGEEQAQHGSGNAEASSQYSGSPVVTQLGAMTLSSRLRRTSVPNAPYCGHELPAGTPLPTPVAMIKACTSPMRLRSSSSGTCSPSYNQLQHRSSNSGSAGGRRFTVNGSVTSCEPKREGAFGLKAAQAASAVAAAIILKPGLNGRSSPINLSIHCPPGVKRPPPESVLCPLSGKVMKDPVFLIASGLTYDRSSLEALMQDGKGICPTTGATFDSSGIVPNQHAKQVVQDWLRANPEPDARRDMQGGLSEVVVGGCGTPVERLSYPGNSKPPLDLQQVAGAAAAAAAAAAASASRQHSTELLPEGGALQQAAGDDAGAAAAAGELTGAPAPAIADAAPSGTPHQAAGAEAPAGAPEAAAASSQGTS